MGGSVGLPEEKVREWEEEPLSSPLCSTSSHFWSSPACSVDHSQLPVAMCFVPPNHVGCQQIEVIRYFCLVTNGPKHSDRFPLHSSVRYGQCRPLAPLLMQWSLQ